MKRTISITLDSDVLERIRDFAEYDDRPVSQYINIILKRHIQRMDAQKNKDSKVNIE